MSEQVLNLNRVRLESFSGKFFKALIVACAKSRALFCSKPLMISKIALSAVKLSPCILYCQKAVFWLTQPKDVYKRQIEALCEQGLVKQKAEYLKSFAEAAVAGQVTIEKFSEMTDAEITKQLVQIRGLGPVSYTHLDVYKRQFPVLWSISNVQVCIPAILSLFIRRVICPSRLSKLSLIIPTVWHLDWK